MDTISYLLLSGIQWSRHTLGIIKHPYTTYRSLANQALIGELLFIFLLLMSYIAVASLIRVPEFRLHLLTKEFLVLLGGAVGGYGLAVATLYGVSRMIGGKGSVGQVSICWAYSLIATICWFFITSFLFVVFPPPRTETFRGISFSFLYLVFSFILFFWKLELYYLTLRFSMKLNLQKIILVSLFFFPIMGSYAILMYRLGIYKVPLL